MYIYIYTYIVCVLDAFDIGKPFLDIRFTQSKYHIIYIYTYMCVCQYHITYRYSYTVQNLYSQHLCYAPKSFGIIVGTLIFGDSSTLWLSSIW
jgi:hypothetical protein